MTTNNHRQSPPGKSSPSLQDKLVLDGIVQALDGLRFGSIEIVVHEGKVTQIERKEKIRF